MTKPSLHALPLRFPCSWFEDIFSLHALPLHALFFPFQQRFKVGFHPLCLMKPQTICSGSIDDQALSSCFSS
ncbi:hypothetical protein RchiOBHm_Chr7g0191721 [Rosa chinensis]|uniref:Uncharacterized protein n=1 Tax=Rosa chinensis TaxID=74649 RepID=A0A2P6P5F7_ROSCH|nr:hypothetical protein RchiOBHm_Chr7g0191721 [Rosa chinensis]